MGGFPLNVRGFCPPILGNLAGPSSFQFIADAYRVSDFDCA